MKIIEVTWIDAFSFDGWTWTSEIKDKLSRLKEPGAVCITVGYFVEERDNAIIVAQSIQPNDEGDAVWDDQMGSVWIIPKATVTKVVVLRDE